MKRIFLTTLLILLTSGSLSAQQVQTITLEEAIDIVLDNNLQVQLSKSDIARRENEYRQRRADFLPNLNANVSGNRTIGRQFDPATVTFDDFTTNNLNTSLSSSVVLFNGFRNINQLRSADLAVQSAEEIYKRTREGIIFETASLFLSVLLNQELLDIDLENLEASRKQLEQVTAQVEVGMRPIVDQFNQESVVANAELRVIRSENSLNLSKLRLTRLLQIDPLLEYDFMTPGISDEDISVKEYDLREMVMVALANRRDVRASELNLQRTRYALSISQGARLPEVTFSGSLSSAFRDQQRDPATGDKLPFSDQFFDANITRGFGFNMRVPIFNRWQTNTQVQQRQIDYRDAELRFEDLRLEVFLELRQAYNDYLAYSKELEVTQKALIAAEKAYETEQERYNVGSATLIELTNANNEFVRASSNRVQAIYQFVFQEKVLDYFLGLISEEIALGI